MGRTTVPAFAQHQSRIASITGQRRRQEAKGEQMKAKAKVKTKKYIVEAYDGTGYFQSGNPQATGEYTKESAERRARTQERKSGMGLKYRIKEVK
jgi:hypothetical protein